MKLQCIFRPVRLDFTFEARTSRAVMHHKDTYILETTDEDTGVTGTGECPLFKGLSAEDTPEYPLLLEHACHELEATGKIPVHVPSSIRMGMETALRDMHNGGKGVIFPGSKWMTEGTGITINGLIWMGDKRTMYDRIRSKLDEGFKCLKLKIGGIDFREELELLQYVRSRFDACDLELRVDANGAFHPSEALEKLKRLSDFSIHSIEQPIKAGQTEEMALLCAYSPISIALDEELIGDTELSVKHELLKAIHPQYIILKPALCGGFVGADEWIAVAEELNIGWWATSALESNVGLSAISQWVAMKNPRIPQGLGTGELYSNNFESHMMRVGSQVFYKP